MSDAERHRRAVAQSLRFAQEAATRGDFDDAPEWLGVVEIVDGCSAVERLQAVNFEEDQAAVRITVRGDGGAFDPTATTGGLALLGMHERVELLEGTLHVQSVSGQGTTARATPSARRQACAQQRSGAG